MNVSTVEFIMMHVQYAYPRYNAMFVWLPRIDIYLLSSDAFFVGCTRDRYCYFIRKSIKINMYVANCTVCILSLVHDNLPVVYYIFFRFFYFIFILFIMYTDINFLFGDTLISSE